jgi:hypothetical protein
MNAMSKQLARLATACLLACTCARDTAATPAPLPPTRGPLTIHPANPRWFADADSRAVYLVGSHTWANFQEIRRAGDKPFDHDAWLAFMTEHHFNFQRLWIWEQAAWATWTKEKLVIEPMPYRRTGPGHALDGGLKFDLDEFDDAFFDRLRARLITCRDRGIYCAVMLFQGFSYKRPVGNHPANPFPGHPFNVANNVQGFNGDADGDSILDLDAPAVRAHHAAFIRKVVETVNDLDNVLYEVINEGGTEDWQYFVVRTVQDYERAKPRQHLVGITGQGAVNLPAALASDAQWVSPGSRDHPGMDLPTYRALLRGNPPAWHQQKPAVLDTDHFWGHGIDPQWPWKSFARGYHVLFMDPWSPLPAWMDGPPGSLRALQNTPDFPGYFESRLAMRNTARLAAGLDLAKFAPHGALASTGFCLADPGRTYIVYLAGGGSVELDLAAARGDFRATWIAAVTGREIPGRSVTGGGKRDLSCPFAGDAVLLLQLDHGQSPARTPRGRLRECLFRRVP